MQPVFNVRVQKTMESEPFLDPARQKDSPLGEAFCIPCKALSSCCEIFGYCMYHSVSLLGQVSKTIAIGTEAAPPERIVIGTRQPPLQFRM